MYTARHTLTRPAGPDSQPEPEQPHVESWGPLGREVWRLPSRKWCIFWIALPCLVAAALLAAAFASTSAGYSSGDRAACRQVEASTSTASLRVALGEAQDKQLRQDIRNMISDSALPSVMASSAQSLVNADTTITGDLCAELVGL